VLCSQIKGAADKQNIYFDSADQRETKEEMRWLDSAVIQPFFYQPVTEQNLSIIFDFGGLSCLSLKNMMGLISFISLSLLFLELANGVLLWVVSCLTDLNFGNIMIILRYGMFLFGLRLSL